MLIKVREALYISQPATSDLMIGIISILFSIIAVTIEITPTVSPTTAAIATVMSMDIWGIAFAIHGALILAGLLLRKKSLRASGSLTGIFLWGAILSIIVFKLSVFPTPIVAMYGVFFVFSAWSFLALQEEQRLHELYGEDYSRVVTENLLQELIDLRKRVESETGRMHDAHEAAEDRIMR